MTEAPITPLRRRMIEDMTIRKFAPRTQEGYIRAVKGFSSFFGASPDRGKRSVRSACRSTPIGAMIGGWRPSRTSVHYRLSGH